MNGIELEWQHVSLRAYIEVVEYGGIVCHFAGFEVRYNVMVRNNNGDSMKYERKKLQIWV